LSKITHLNTRKFLELTITRSFFYCIPNH